MATTPMTFEIVITAKEWFTNPLLLKWGDYHPIFGDDTFPLFLKQEYNINIINYTFIPPGHMRLEFKSTQDYILWKLHQ